MAAAFRSKQGPVTWTVSLPLTLIADLRRLADLRGTDLDHEVADDLAFLGHLAGELDPGTMLEHLFELNGSAKAPVRLHLQGHQAQAISALAKAYGCTRGDALSAVLGRGVRALVAAQERVASRGERFADAYLSLLAA